MKPRLAILGLVVAAFSVGMMFVDHGIISMQLEGRGDNTASFRNLWLKNLP